MIDSCWSWLVGVWCLLLFIVVAKVESLSYCSLLLQYNGIQIM